ncbi:hypothetical protein [Limnoglobus roseus]|uniref:Uncharacterized protein n=1 Tax=Limnoglobus roseus TaxID=2598579 RepID=A0A5C1AEG2_9BACT|nr:hypothetical protein [Limnoglobus roseus]QEL16607.1 hypothetical protein PX52LOC_03567 [Limnoglobus roseus]
MTEPLFDDSRTRAAELYERFALVVAGRLERRYRGVDPQRVADAVVDAILRLCGAWDAPANLARVLTGFARQRLRVLLRGEVRRKRREAATAPRSDTTLSLEDRELAAALREAVATTTAERLALDSWLAGTPPADAALLARLRQRIHRLKAKVIHDA